MIKYLPWSKDYAEKLAIMEKDIFSDPWSLFAILDAIKSPAFYGVVMLDNEEVIGYYGMYIIEPEGHIANIAIKKSEQGKGLSNALLSHLLILGEKMGVTDFTLEVRRSNYRAISLYEKFGFKLEGVRKGYYSDKEDALIYWKRTKEEK